MLLIVGEVYQFQHFLLSIFHQAAVSEYVDIVIQNHSNILLPKKDQRRS